MKAFVIHRILAIAVIWIWSIAALSCDQNSGQGVEQSGHRRFGRVVVGSEIMGYYTGNAIYKDGSSTDVRSLIIVGDDGIVMSHDGVKGVWNLTFSDGARLKLKDPCVVWIDDNHKVTSSGRILRNNFVELMRGYSDIEPGFRIDTKEQFEEFLETLAVQVGEDAAEE